MLWLPDRIHNANNVGQSLGLDQLERIHIANLTLAMLGSRPQPLPGFSKKSCKALAYLHQKKSRFVGWVGWQRNLVPVNPNRDVKEGSERQAKMTKGKGIAEEEKLQGSEQLTNNIALSIHFLTSSP